MTKERHWVVELAVGEVKEEKEEKKELDFFIKSFVKMKVAYENNLIGTHPTRFLGNIR